MSTKQQRIAELAKQSPQMGFTSLAYLMDIEWLHEAYQRTRKDGAVGVDGQTAEEYERDLKKNLQSLLDRTKSGTYRAPPVRRVHIPKGGSTNETRPIGIPTLEDKILQRAVVMLLEPIMSRTFMTAHMVSGLGDRHTERLMRFGNRRWTVQVAGLWRWTSENFSTLWIMPTCGSCCSDGCVMVCCCV